MQIYNVRTDTWEDGPDLPHCRTYGTAQLLGNKIVMIGSNAIEADSKIDIFDLGTNQWHTIVSDQFDIWDSLSSVAYNNKMYLFGGCVGPNRDYTNSVMVLEIGIGHDDQLSVLLKIGETAQLIVTNRLNDNTEYEWSSGDSAIAHVSGSGMVTATSVGTAEIMAQSADGEFSESIWVKVIDEDEEDERLKLYLTVGEEKRLYLNEDYENIRWTSMDESKVTVNYRGKVKAIASGLAMIQAEYEGEVSLIYVYVG